MHRCRAGRGVRHEGGPCETARSSTHHPKPVSTPRSPQPGRPAGSCQTTLAPATLSCQPRAGRQPRPHRRAIAPNSFRAIALARPATRGHPGTRKPASRAGRSSSVVHVPDMQKARFLACRRPKCLARLQVSRPLHLHPRDAVTACQWHVSTKHCRTARPGRAPSRHGAMSGRAVGGPRHPRRARTRQRRSGESPAAPAIRDVEGGQNAAKSRYPASRRPKCQAHVRGPRSLHPHRTYTVPRCQRHLLANDEGEVDGPDLAAGTITRQLRPDRRGWSSAQPTHR
jgi:hypothetical protein